MPGVNAAVLPWPAFPAPFVHPNLSEIPRISISFNVMLKWSDAYLPSPESAAPRHFAAGFAGSLRAIRPALTKQTPTITNKTTDAASQSGSLVGAK